MTIRARIISPISVFALLYFLSAYLLAILWYNNGYFLRFDILFDADANTNLESLSHGWGRHAISHAFLEFFSIPIRIITVMLYKLDLISDQISARAYIGLAINPLAAAVKYVYFYKLLSLFDLSNRNKWLILLTYSMAFSNIIFAIVPETYGISGALITILFYLYFRDGEGQAKNTSNIFVWSLNGILLTGITITNICIFFLVYAGHLYFKQKTKFIKAILHAALVSGAIFICVIGIYELAHFVLGYEKGNEGGVSWIQKFLTRDTEKALYNGLNLLAASFSSVFPIGISSLENSHCRDIGCGSVTTSHNLGDSILYIKSVLVLVILAWSYSKVRHIDTWRQIFLIAILVLLFNFSLHLIFGGYEMFLYTQHWMLPLFLLLIPLLSNNSKSTLIFLIIQIIFTGLFLVQLPALVWP